MLPLDVCSSLFAAKGRLPPALWFAGAVRGRGYGTMLLRGLALRWTVGTEVRRMMPPVADWHNVFARCHVISWMLVSCTGRGR